MRRNQTFVLLAVLLCFSVYSSAQSTAGIIDPSRAVDWSGAGIPGGIPNRTTICSTLNPGATAAQITSAISGCPSNQVVFLTAGTYNLSSGIDFANKSNVTLRGAGANQTFLVFSGGTGCTGPGADICIRNGDGSYAGGPANLANWTAGYARGTTQITLSSTTNLHPGTSIMVLDQLDDSNSDNGGVWVCQTQGACASEGPSGGQRGGRAQSQMVLVTAVSGNTVTISPGIYMPNWSSGKSPQAWYAGSIVTGDGIENLSMDHTSGGTTAGVMMFNAYQCWVKGVRSITANRSHVWFFQTAHSVVKDSYFYGSQNSAQQSYGIEEYIGSDNLVENNIMQHIVSPYITNGASVGSVYSYNYNFDDYFSPSTGLMMFAGWLHSAGTAYDLFEGNQGNGWAADGIHGTHDFITLFRNQYLGWESGKNNQMIAVEADAYSRYFNFVGNVLGKSGFSNQYTCVPGCSNYNGSIFAIGGSPGGGVPNDQLAVSSAMRWGNYDTVNNSTRWNATEVPSGIGQFANPVPGTQNLPASFYLSSRPSWWGAMPWPAVGPDVVGGADTSGHAYLIPAQVCYNSTSKTNAILNFNASACYSLALSAPNPPTNVKATVQ